MLLHLRQFVYQFDKQKRSFECTAMVPLTVGKLIPMISFATKSISQPWALRPARFTYLAFKIHLNQKVTDVAEDLALQSESASLTRSAVTDQALAYAKRICRPLPYCFNEETGVGGKLISISPFDSACQTFTRANNDPVLARTRAGKWSFVSRQLCGTKPMGINAIRGAVSPMLRSLILGGCKQSGADEFDSAVGKCRSSYSKDR